MGKNDIIYAVLKCNYCGKDVEVHHKKRLEAEHVFCNRECMGKFFRTNPEPNCICRYCGKAFYRKPSHIIDKETGEKKKYIYCSLKCCNEDRKELYKGENNHQYGLKGELNASFKSNEKITHYGYRKIRCLDHPFKDCDGFVFEHRLVAEKYLLNDENSIEINGKLYLKPELEVHHIDKNKLNNDPSNLMVLTKSEHLKIHHPKIKQDKIKEPQKPKEVKLCPVCNKMIPSSLVNHQICCSVECSNIYRNRGRVETFCDNCGKKIRIRKSRFEKTNNHFCCRDCYMQYRNK